MRTQTQKKSGRGRPRSKPISLREIKRAISQFISNTEKIVRTVTPNASIVVPNPLYKQRTEKKQRKQRTKARFDIDNMMQTQESSIDTTKWVNSAQILTPNFKEVNTLEISDSDCSDEDTESEVYLDAHSPRERIEGLLRMRPELRRIKSNGRSTLGIHARGDTMNNLSASLDVASRYMDPLSHIEYLVEGIDILPWPISEPEENLVIKIQ